MMRVVSVTYSPKNDQPDPQAWLDRLDFYNGVLEALADYCEVISIDLINWQGSFSRKGVQHIFLPHHTKYPALNRFVNQLKPDVVLVQGFGFPMQVVHYGRIKDVAARIIMQHHAERPYSGIRKWLFRFADRYVDRYFFATTSVADEWLRKKIILSGNKIIAVPEASSVFTSDGQEKDRGSYLWVGRANANKDPFTMIEAFKQFASRHPSVKLWMVCPEGELRREMERRVASSEHIQLVGRVVDREEMKMWYERSEFIICSSFYEGCNISVLEGMSCGCIPIVTKIPSFDLHTNNGRLGLQFEAGRADALFQQLNETRTMNVTRVRDEIIQYFDEALSFKAIAAKIYAVMTSVAV